MKKILLLFTFLSMLLGACTPAPAIVTIEAGQTEEAAVPTLETGLDFQPVDLRVGHGVKDGWLEIYFTDPTSPYRHQKEGGPDEILAQAIQQAHTSVDVAAYSFNLWSIRDALLDAHRRGVLVRVVLESSNWDDDVPVTLRAAGIPMVGDRRNGLMHDKFVVIDQAEVWTGSMNFTVGGAYYDANNLIRIRSTKVAADYTKEFEEMFLDDKFGPDTVAETPYPAVNIDGTQIEVYFSPDDGVDEAILPLLENAQESIYFLAYSFTSDDLGEAVRAAAAEGVQVRGVMDADQIKSNTGTEYDPFRQAGIDVRRDTYSGLMHHKVFIIDREIVVTGSYNFSRNAEERNDENIVIIYSPQAAQEFINTFWEIYNQSVE